MVLIGFLGRKGSGKDTASDYLVNRYKFKKISFAEPIKEGCRELFGFNDDQLYGNKKEDIDEFWNTSPRKIFQYLGTDIFRKDINKIIPNIQNNFWVKSFEKKYMKLFTSESLYVVSDVRFENEIDLIHKYCGYIVKINRSNANNDDQHSSEKEIDNLKGDYYINNNSSLDDLYKTIDEIYNKIG